MALPSILIAQGTFADIYEPAWNRSLKELGVASQIFRSHSFTLPGVLGRIERRILWGPGVARLKREFVARIKRDRPEVTLLYQGPYFDRQTLEQIRPYTFIAGYHNDDPFGSRSNMLRYRLLLPALPLYHGFHVYRSCNIEEAKAHGVPRVKRLMSYYLPWQDYPCKMSLEQESKWGCELVFAGHAENDLRVECLVQAVKRGVQLRLYGEDYYWQKALPKEVYRKVMPITKAVGDDYRKALCGAKIAACFFSKWNRDEYTRRSFEIPACGVFLLSERTPVMEELYQEGKEAEFFDSPGEFLDKVRFYLKNESARRQIAENGYQRVTTSGHDIYSRMKQWLRDIEHWRHEQKGS